MTQFKLSPPDSTRLHWIPLESSGVQQTPADSTRFHQILLESTRVCWTLVDSGGLQYVTECHIM